MASDVEVVAAAIDVLREFGLGSEDFVVRYSDRDLISAVLNELGIPASALPATFAALDKSDRESAEWLSDRLVEAGAEATAAASVLGLAGTSLEVLSEQFGDVPAISSPVERLGRFRAHGNAVLLGPSSFWEGVDVRGQVAQAGLGGMFRMVTACPHCRGRGNVILEKCADCRGAGGSPIRSRSGCRPGAG